VTGRRRARRRRASTGFEPELRQLVKRLKRMQERCSSQLISLRSSGLILVLLCTGCGSWEWRKIDLTPQALGKDQAEIWSRSGRFVWDSVTIGADSVTGITVRALPPHTQRHSLPLVDVDSIRKSHVTLRAGNYILITAVAAGGLYAIGWLLLQPEH